MAIGIALLFNIKLPINFNSPYKATSIQDFWRRWHITLSRFLKDYIYIPLGGNRKGELKTYINLMTTFIIGGIWHGASWLFVFWGFLHGLALVIYRVWSKFGFKLWSWLAWFITFNFVNISRIFFRAKSWEDAIKVLNGMFSLDIILPNQLSDKLSFLKEYGFEFGHWIDKLDNNGIGLTVWLIFGLILVLMFKNSNEQLRDFENNPKTLIISTIIFLWAILSLNKISEFLYFNF